MGKKYERTDPVVLECIAKQLREINSGGYTHDAYLVDKIGGLGYSDLHTFDRPFVGFGQDGDPWYQQYFKNWSEVNALINQLKCVATQAWGPENE